MAQLRWSATYTSMIRASHEAARRAVVKVTGIDCSLPPSCNASSCRSADRCVTGCSFITGIDLVVDGGLSAV